MDTKDDKIQTTTGNLANPSRRTFLKTTAAAAAITAAPALLTKYARASGRTIKIGWVSPKTGVVANFAETNEFILAQVQKAVATGLTINGKNYPVQIILKDSRSDPNRASEVAAQLIKSDKVDLITAAVNGDTVNPVADLAEINNVPCLTTDCPWQIYYFRGNNKGFKWSYHFWWGVDDLMNSYLGMWKQLPTNKVVGCLWPNDAEGIGFGDAKMGFPPAMLAAGFKVVDPGRFPHDSPDFSAQISEFKKTNCEILTGVLPSGTFTTFWSQAAQQGYKPKILTMAKAIMFPAAVNGMGDRCLGLSSEMWWSPYYPFKSGLTGQTCRQLADEWEAKTGRQWTPPLGMNHALFEVAIDILKRTKSIDSPEAILDSMVKTNYESIFGHVQWTGKPVKNVSTTPIVGGQWVRGKKFKYDLIPVDNSVAKMVPVQAKLKPLA